MVRYIPGNSNMPIILNNYEIGIGSGNPYTSKWKYSGATKKFGIEISEFEKDPITIPILFRFRGSVDSISENAEKFFRECEKDILHKRPGKFVVNNWYVRGYFIERETNVAEEFYGLELSTTLLAPHPFWINEQEIKIKPISEGEAVSEETGFKIYPYTYPYRYPILQTEINEYIDHYTDSDFKMIVYGPTTSVLINIAGHPYEVQYPIEAGEYMVIDSRPNTPREEKLYVVRTNGTKESIFNYRSTENSVFKKIPPGQVKIDYARTYGMELIIYKERSEPPWKS